MIVESPAKARKIQGFLGQGYRVMASLGHVCDLSQKEGSVKPEQDFALVWEVDAKKRQLLADMAAAVSGTCGACGRPCTVQPVALLR